MGVSPYRARGAGSRLSDHDVVDHHGQVGDPAGGHGADAHDQGDHAAEFRDRFWIRWSCRCRSSSTARWCRLVRLLGAVVHGQRPGRARAGQVVYLYGGRPFLAGAVDEVRGRQPGMMLLIAMAITVAFAASWATVGLFELDFWWELAALVVIMLLGHWMEMRALGQARGALVGAGGAAAGRGRARAPRRCRGVPVSELARGRHRARAARGARPGRRRARLRGAASSTSRWSPASRGPVAARRATVIAGTVVAGSLGTRPGDAVGDATRLAGIQRLVAEAETSRSRAQALADRAAALLFYIATAQQ